MFYYLLLLTKKTINVTIKRNLKERRRIFLNVISVILFIISFVILCSCLCVKNSNFLDIRQIFIQHLSMFKGNPLQLIGVFLATLLLAIGLSEFKCIDVDILINLDMMLSVLATILLLSLGVLCSVGKVKNENHKQLLKETVNTTIFELILFLLLFFGSFIALIICDFKESIALKIVSCIIYYLTMLIILNVLVVIKRIKVIFDNQ